MASYPTSVNPFGTIAASGASRSSLYSERTAVANLLAELSAVETDLVTARGGSGSIAARLTAIDSAVTSAQSTAISTAATDATTKANAAIATASADATTKANAAQSAAATDATTKANAALASALIAYPGRNKFVNGNHDSRLRGNGPWTASGPTIDGVYMNLNGSTASQYGFLGTVGSSPVAGLKEYGYWNYTNVVSVAGSGNYVNSRYLIDNAATLAGQTVTLSFYAWTGDVTRPMAVEVTQTFGSGGSPSAEVQAINVIKPTVAVTPTRYTTTFTMPSVSGKTFGTNGDSAVNINFWYDAGSTLNARTLSLGQQSGNFNIDMVQLEAGSVATPFEFVDPAVTRVKCLGSKFNGYGISEGSANLVQNGCFRFFQRATSAALTGSWTYVAADRWIGTWTGTGGAVTVSQQYGTDAGRCLRIQRNSGSTATGQARQDHPIDSLTHEDLRGKWATLRFRVRKGANFVGTTSVLIKTGTGYNEGAGTALTGEAYPLPWTNPSPALGLGFQTYTYAVYIPIGTTQSQISFDCIWSASTAGAADYYDIERVELYAGAAPASYQLRLFNVEKALCERWFRSRGATGYGPQGASLGTSYAYVTWPITPSMARTPTVTTQAGPFTNCIVRTGLANYTPTAITVVDNNYDHVLMRYDGTYPADVPLQTYFLRHDFSADL